MLFVCGNYMEEKVIVKLVKLIKKDDSSRDSFYSNNLDCISQEIDKILDDDNFQEIVTLLDFDNFYKIILSLYYITIDLKKVIYL